MTLSSPALPIGDYNMQIGSSGRDLITGIGGQIVLAGKGDDIMDALSTVAADGTTPLIPWLAGGGGDDRYYINPGNNVIIADLAGGNETVYLDAFRFQDMQVRKTDSAHILLSQGNTNILLASPAGRSIKDQAIEKIVFRDTKTSGRKILRDAKKIGNYMGEISMEQMDSTGIFPMSYSGLDPALFNGYILSANYNNSLVI